MKKWLSVISILVLVIVLAGCGKDKEDNKKSRLFASPAPHGDVLKKAKEQLKKKVMI